MEIQIAHWRAHARNMTLIGVFRITKFEQPVVTFLRAAERLPCQSDMVRNALPFVQ
jgi:hypothetical protein